MWMAIAAPFVGGYLNLGCATYGRNLKGIDYPFRAGDGNGMQAFYRIFVNWGYRACATGLLK